MSIKVFIWSGQLGQQRTGPWTYGQFVVAAPSVAALRAACREVGLHRPSETHLVKLTSEVATLALAAPGTVFFRSGEQGDDNEWHPVPPQPN